MNNIKIGVQIFRILLEKGQLDREEHSDLFIEYLNSEVQQVLDEFEEEMECKIIKINNTIYLLPNYDNSLLGFKNKDFRQWIGSNARLSDVYLSYYIAMFILFKFYDGKNKSPKQREFMRILTLIDELDKRFEVIINKGAEMVVETEEEFDVNLASIAKLWKEKITLEENKRKTKYGTILRICSLLEQENLIRLLDNKKEIRTTKKLDDLMTYYFLNDSRIEEINKIFDIKEVGNASN
ncbi:MAG: hypothetical protein H0S78_00145 [Tissierellales bacterium]|nr:hypothetical protein [Tissierellales bacterium]